LPVVAPNRRLLLLPQRTHIPETFHEASANHDCSAINDIPWIRYSPVGKVVEFGVQPHTGKQCALANQLFMAASCIVLISTVVFGVVLSWTRRPGTRFNQSGPWNGFNTPKVVVGVAIALGFVFPLVGLSMLLVVILEPTIAQFRRGVP
jgi:uncharacterized iron-regulated membrane protein